MHALRDKNGRKRNNTDDIQNYLRNIMQTSTPLTLSDTQFFSITDFRQAHLLVEPR